MSNYGKKIAKAHQVSGKKVKANYKMHTNNRYATSVKIILNFYLGDLPYMLASPQFFANKFLIEKVTVPLS